MHNELPLHAGLQAGEMSDKSPDQIYITGEPIKRGMMTMLGDDGKLYVTDSDHWAHQIGVAPRDLEAGETVTFPYRL